jgi:hypothetical protein
MTITVHVPDVLLEDLATNPEDLERLTLGLGTRGHPPKPPLRKRGKRARLTFPPSRRGGHVGWFASAGTRAQSNR